MADGYLYSETDTGRVVVLKADGTLDYRLASSDDAALAAIIYGG